jgi:predicted nucleic acid-binding Zn finger protein
MADVLENWDFRDEAANGTEGLINRQKSAGNLVMLALDRTRRTGVFLDREKKIQSSASLSSCDCRDFHYVGRVPRKTLQPCKHIYRLAMELGLLDPKYLDHDAREALRTCQLGELKRIEDDRLLSLGRDPGQWGAWPGALHSSGLQKNRQYRAYFIVDDESEYVHRDRSAWAVREYLVTLDGCTCADFNERRLPCKHIYAVALKEGISLPLSMRPPGGVDWSSCLSSRANTEIP